jgi:hypothetical protein
MSEQPTYKYVDGVLVELTQAEIDAIMAERAALAQEPVTKPATEKPDAPRRTD